MVQMVAAAGGSGIVIVKELNKATGVWNLKSQFSAQKAGRGRLKVSTVDYLVVAGGGRWRKWYSRRRRSWRI
jgi:hypothetical protein